MTTLDEPVVAPPAAARVRHVFVNLSRLKQAPAEYPGLLVDWRRTTRGWEAQVAYVVDADEPSLHVAWCSADRLRPLG